MVPERVLELGNAIDELGKDTADLGNRGLIASEEVVAHLLDTQVLLKAVYQMCVEKFEAQ